MSRIPIFGDESALPRTLAGLNFEQVEIYPDPRLGVSARYGNPAGVKADVYLYDLGRKDIPADLRSEAVMGWFQEACQNVFMMVERGVYLDLETRVSQYLHLPPDAADPFCLWACFAYRQAPQPGVTYTGVRVSNLALRTDRGLINKLRYTYPDTPEMKDTGLRGFLMFLLEWTLAVQSFGVKED